MRGTIWAEGLGPEPNVHITGRDAGSEGHLLVTRAERSPEPWVLYTSCRGEGSALGGDAGSLGCWVWH